MAADDAQAALADPRTTKGSTYKDAALVAVVAITGGYPYFLQELGYAVWAVAEGPTDHPRTTSGRQSRYEAKLDASFFRVRLDRATGLQRAYLRAMAQFGRSPRRPRMSPR